MPLVVHAGRLCRQGVWASMSFPAFPSYAGLITGVRAANLQETTLSDKTPLRNRRLSYAAQRRLTLLAVLARFHPNALIFKLILALICIETGVSGLPVVPNQICFHVSLYGHECVSATYEKILASLPFASV
jgi:hypothetical protein